MGVSASSRRETQLANERAYVRSLGDRYPLGDGELRKWCWCHSQMSSASPPSGTKPDALVLSMLAVRSAIYGDYNPYARRSQLGAPTPNPFIGRKNAADKVLEALDNIEQHIFPAGLSSDIARKALGVSLKSNGHLQKAPGNNDPIRTAKSIASQSKSPEEVAALEESFYSIATLVDQYQSAASSSPYDNASRSIELEDFLEGMSASCGRRGSRASLSKLFAIVSDKSAASTSSNPFQAGGQARADASKLIQTAYCLSLAASYLKAEADSHDKSGSKKGKKSGMYQDYVPRDNTEEMKSMVDSLLESATQQWRSSRGLGGNIGFHSSGHSENADMTTVSLEEFLEWAETCVPLLGSALPTFLHVLFTFFSPSAHGDGKEPRFPPGVTPLWMPSLTVEKDKRSTHSSPTSSFFLAPASSSFDLFALSCTSLTLASGRWHRLFSSEANGLSCNRLMHSILGYGGPTIILIRSKDTSDKGKCSTSVFGAYTFTPWTEESSGFYGNSDCFLFRLGPDPMAVYRPKGGGDMGGMDAFGMNNTTANQESERHNYMYFNPEARSKGYDGLAHGIGFGGNSDLPRLYIDEVLDGCRAAPEDMTYEKGPLLSGLKEVSSATSHFEVEAMEAWGVGTSEIVEDALLARDGQREDVQKRIRQAMKGAKGQFLEDFQKGLVGNKVFQHRDQMQARGGACVLNDDDDDDEEEE